MSVLDVQGSSPPAHLTRTAGEFLGRRPVPRVIAGRSLVFLLGPEGSGKSSVALRLLEPDPLVIDGPALRAHLVSRARNGRFAVALENAPRLLLDGVDCLYGREGAVRFLASLLRDRCAAGRRTGVVQGSADDSVVLLYPSVAPEHRASVLLRFPVGRGRRLFVQRECARAGVPFPLARELEEMTPWSYASVRAAVDALASGPTPPAATG